MTVGIYQRMAPEGNKDALDCLDDGATNRNPAATRPENAANWIR
jgi:hypothetical protein